MLHTQLGNPAAPFTSRQCLGGCPLFASPKCNIRSAARKNRRNFSLRADAGVVNKDTEEVDATADLLARAREGVQTDGIDGRAFRRSLNKTGRYTRKPVNDKESIELMDKHGVGYSLRGLVARMKDNKGVWQEGDVTVRLAEAYGFCWGVERAVQMAYEARKAYPGQKLHITNELIHNPSVNQRLQEMDINIIEDPGTGKDFTHVGKGDVVILPAFGASVQEMKLLNDKQATMVDTTCPWVSKVWNAVDRQASKKHTSVIHGKWAHEETVATASFATTYVIVKDLKQAQFVCDYILGQHTREEFFEEFHPNAYSKGFDPDADLIRIGLANQTTMLKGDTQKIGKMLESAMMQKVGPAELKNHFMIMDTICDATQERQDAVYDLTGHQQEETEKKLDMMLVVGGFNSSNTSHLQEIGELKGVPSFWVNGPQCIDTGSNSIQHKTSWGELVTTDGWLPAGPLTIGVTSGASTPDRSVEDVLDQVFRIKDPNFTGIPLLDVTAADLQISRPDHEEEV